jgi:hypothetical protein
MTGGPPAFGWESERPSFLEGVQPAYPICPWRWKLSECGPALLLLIEKILLPFLGFTYSYTGPRP